MQIKQIFFGRWESDFKEEICQSQFARTMLLQWLLFFLLDKFTCKTEVSSNIGPKIAQLLTMW